MGVEREREGEGEEREGEWGRERGAALEEDNPHAVPLKDDPHDSRNFRQSSSHDQSQQVQVCGLLPSRKGESTSWFRSVIR